MRRGHGERPRRHSIPQSVPLFLAHGSGPLPCTRALSEYAGASHTQVRGCARARVFPITCNFVGLVKHSGTEWVTVGREKKNTTRKNNYVSPSNVQSPVSYLPTYTRCFIFSPPLALRLPQCAIGMALGQGHVSRGAHWVVAQRRSRSAVGAGSTGPRSIEGRCPRPLSRRRLVAAGRRASAPATTHGTSPACPAIQ